MQFFLFFFLTCFKKLNCLIPNFYNDRKKTQSDNISAITRYWQYNDAIFTWYPYCEWQHHRFSFYEKSYKVYGNISVCYMYSTVIKVRTVKLCQKSVVYI